MIPRLVAAASRATLATCLLATTLSAAGPALAADKPDLRLTITASDTQVALGDTVDFTYTIANIGSVAVGSARLEGTITGGQSPKIIQQPSGQPQDCTLSGTALTCTKLVLGPADPNSNSDFANVVVRVTASSSNTTTKIEASGTADPDNKIDEADEPNNITGKNNSDDLKVSVIRLPDLKATIEDGPDFVKGGARVTFKVKAENLGGSADHVKLDFRTTGGLNYDSVDFVDSVKHGFSCEIHNPWPVGINYVSCSGGSLGDPYLDPTNDESVTIKINATVKDQGFTSSDRTVTFKVDPDHTIGESNEKNNSDNFTYHYS
jgi:subtilase family serine protease